MKKIMQSGRFSVLLLVGVLAFTGAATAQPLDPASTTAQAIRQMDAVQWRHLSRQLTRSLDSPVAQIRQEAMQHINFFATHYGDRVDFTSAVPELLRIYDADATEGYRIMALAALHAIGDEGAMQYLRQAVQWERSERVRKLTLAALADHVAQARAL